MIVLIQTRWHEDDLAGRLLQDQPGRWAVLRLPAVAETQDERDENNRRLGLPPGGSRSAGPSGGRTALPDEILLRGGGSSYVGTLVLRRGTASTSVFRVRRKGIGSNAIGFRSSIRSPGRR